jgi:predicted O-methyltransferase YrrM
MLHSQIVATHRTIMGIERMKAPSGIVATHRTIMGIERKKAPSGLWSKTKLSLTFVAIISLALLSLFGGAPYYNYEMMSFEATSEEDSRSTFFPSQEFFDVLDARDAESLAEHYVGLVTKYGSELRREFSEADRYFEGKDRGKCKGQIGKMEAAMLYILIREDQPQHVLEVGALCGSSTRWILAALQQNGHGKLTTFDLWDLAPQYVDPKLAAGRWDFHQQDVLDYVQTPPGQQMHREIDLYFMDALHRNAFALQYTKQLLAPTRHRVSVFVHDVFSPFLLSPLKTCQGNMTQQSLSNEIDCLHRTALEWSAKHTGSSDVLYGPTQASGEGAELMSWLARTGRSRGLTTFSPYAAPKFFHLVATGFQEKGLHFSQINNPAVFFELDVRRTTELLHQTSK